MLKRNAAYMKGLSFTVVINDGGWLEAKEGSKTVMIFDEDYESEERSLPFPHTVSAGEACEEDGVPTLKNEMNGTDGSRCIVASRTIDPSDANCMKQKMICMKDGA